MGNALGGKWRRTAKVMTVEGITYKYKPPATATAALRGHPGHHLLESEEVKRLGLRARPLDTDAPLKPGKLYFLVELPRSSSAVAAGDDQELRAPRKTWSGALHVGAKERLESLMLSRRSMSEVAAFAPTAKAAGTGSSLEAAGDGAVRLRMRLPRSEVVRLMKESKDAAEAAEKIMQLCVARDRCSGPPPSAPPAALTSDKKSALKKEKRCRFVTVPDEIME